MVIDRSIFGGPCSGEENTEVMLDSEWIGQTAPQDVCRVEGCSPCLYFMIQRGCAGSTCGWCHLRHDPRNESFGRFSLFSLITMTSPKDLGIFGVLQFPRNTCWDAWFRGVTSLKAKEKPTTQSGQRHLQRVD